MQELLSYPQALAMCRLAQMFVRRMDPGFPDFDVQQTGYLLLSVRTMNPGDCYTTKQSIWFLPFFRSLGLVVG